MADINDGQPSSTTENTIAGPTAPRANIDTMDRKAHSLKDKVSPLMPMLLYLYERATNYYIPFTEAGCAEASLQISRS